jgi:hypothetical protein
MTSTDRYRHAPRLVLAAAVGLGAVFLAPLAQADPPGNNGTVKIAEHGDIDSIPNNTPHVGCTFTVEWYGFDEGPDIVSTVSFAEHAPTTGVGMTVSGPGQVFVGGDPATGAGTPTGFDGRQVYTLSFTGAPHPQQGYHVKLTIHTPGSIGNDTKSKVFWVRGCTPPTPTPTTPPPTTPTETPTTPTQTPTTPTPTTPTTPAPTTPTQPPTSPVTPAATPGASPTETPATAAPAEESEQPEVLGEQAFAGQGGASEQELPTAVNSGMETIADEGPGTTPRVLLGSLLVLLGLALGRWGWTRARG